MKLVFVESPSKAKTINKYLGNNYKVVASYGHIRQLPSKKGSVDPHQNFKMIWEETAQAKKRLSSLSKDIKTADEIYLATDPDREGEAISWHLYNYFIEKKLLKKHTKICRVVFNSITKDNIKKAFDNPRNINQELVDAYFTRVSLDYLVGFGISPILWKKLPGSRSAGRVQSVALRVICERENEIDNFIKEEYWDIITELYTPNNELIKSKLFQIDQKNLDKFAIKNAQEADKLKQQISNSKFYLADIEEKKLNRNPYPPFTTSTMQQDAVNKLGFSAKYSMSLAQKLYEGIKLENTIEGLITYMRTDATQIDEQCINDIRKYINHELGKDYLPNTKRIYNTKSKNAQEAHEAIRPTNIYKTPASLKPYLDKDLYLLYELIWKRTIASQMNSAKLKLTNYIFYNQDSSLTLKANGNILEFDGFYKIYKNISDDDNNILPNLPINTAVIMGEILPKQHFTEPPPRYSEASLIKKLEELGIGRPSTYASIISVLQDRKYTVLQNKRFIPESRGRILNVFLKHYFSKYVEYDFTANLEDELDKITTQQNTQLDVLNNFWQAFESTLTNIETISPIEINQIINEQLLPYFKQDTLCPLCNEGSIGIKTSKFGAFLGCSRYPECPYTSALVTADEQDNDNNAILANQYTIGTTADGHDIWIKKGPYGFYVESFIENKTKRSSIPSFIEVKDITKEQALFLLNLPLKLSEDISVSIGKFGPYIKQGSTFYSLKENIFEVTLEKALAIIKKEQQKKEGITLGKHPDTKKSIILKYARYGYYLIYNQKNVVLPKEFKKNGDVSLQEAIKIINNNME